MMMIIYC